MRLQANDKVDIVFKYLATGIYRRWWWANYKQDQSAIRSEWIKVLSRFTASEVRQGLKDWDNKQGVSTPPTPKAFASSLLPVHTQASRTSIAQARQLLI